DTYIWIATNWRRSAKSATNRLFERLHTMLFGRKNRKPISIPVKTVKEWKYTTCNYCSTGCAIEIGLNENGKVVTSRGHAGADVNRGKLCIKGLLEHELFD